jgi:hypothetical protein
MPTGDRRSRAAPRGDGEYRKAPVGILRCPICSSGMFRRLSIGVNWLVVLAWKFSSAARKRIFEPKML